MITDVDRVHEYFQKYDQFDRMNSRRLGRTTAYLVLLRDYVVAGPGKFLYITHSNAGISYVRSQFLDMLDEWGIQPSRVYVDRVCVDSCEVRFVAKSFNRVQVKGVSLDAIFADAHDVDITAIIPCLRQTGKVYGYE